MKKQKTPQLGFKPSQTKELRRIQTQSQKLIDDLEALMLQLSTEADGQVPQGLITALTFGKNLPLWIGLTLDE